MGFLRQKLQLKLHPKLRSKLGSALIVALSVIGMLAITSSLMIDRYFQNNKKLRTSGAKVEANALFTQIQQAISNENLCSSAFQSYSFQNVETGHIPQAVTLPSLNAVVGGHAFPIAYPGMISNGVSVALSTGSEPALQLTGGVNYIEYGTQITGLTAYQGLNCASVNLHVVASKERSLVSSSERHTVGLETLAEDFPIMLFTDPSTHQIKSCFGGMPRPGTCIQAAPATMNTLTPGTQCVTPGPLNFTWSATNASYVQINCTSPSVLSGNLTASPATLDMSTVPAGTLETCTATAYNSAFVPSLVSLPATVYVEATCNPPVVTMSRSVACVNPGQSYTISWTDNDPEPTGIETLTGIGAPGPFTPPVMAGGSLTQTPTSPGTKSYSITDTNFVGSSTDSKSVAVIPPPTFSVPLTVTPSQVFTGGSIVFNYTGLNATGASYQDPVTLLNVVKPISGPITVPAPLAGGSYSYLYTLAGGCAGDPPVTASVPVTVCVCVPTNQALTPLGNPSLDSCGILRAACPGTMPLCACVPANQALVGSGLPTLNSCGVLDAGCPGSLPPCVCVPANQALINVGLPSLDSCGVVNPTCPGTKAIPVTCGTANGGSVATAPTSGLCSDSSHPTVSGTGPWTWMCAGHSCSASLAPSCYATGDECGGNTVVVGCDIPPPLPLGCSKCCSGTSNWYCALHPSDSACTGTPCDQSGVHYQECSGPMPVNCGSADGVAVTTAPTSGLCSDGSHPGVSGTGPWNWTCGTASCSAPLAANCNAYASNCGSPSSCFQVRASNDCTLPGPGNFISPSSSFMIGSTQCCCYEQPYILNNPHLGNCP